MDSKKKQTNVPKMPSAKTSVADRVKAISTRTFIIVLAIVSFAVYANTLQNGYVLDDATVITQNTIVTKGFKGIPELLVTPRLKGYTEAKDVESYRPVPMITHAVEYELFGLNAAVNHLVNVLLFVGCVIALFLFLDKLLPTRRSVAFIAALLFALHPIHTEVVANIKSRDELLCFLFAFLALNSFVKFVSSGKRGQILGGGLMLLLSFLSKETVISFIFIVPLIFIVYITEHRRRRLAVMAVTFGATACFMIMRMAVLGPHHANTITFFSNPLISAPDLSTRLATAIDVLGQYLKLLIIPYPLICDYSYNSIPFVSFGNWFVLVSLAVYAALLIIAVYRLTKNKKDLWAFAILFYLGTIALFSNIAFLVYSEMAERFLFFASTGFCLALALAYDKWISNNESILLNNKRFLATVVPVCIIFATLTIARNAEWKDNYTLYSADVKKAPNDCELNFYLAMELSHHMYDEEPNPANKLQLDQQSLEYLTKAISIYPSFDLAHAEMGRIYERLQMYDSAIAHDEAALNANAANSIAAYNLARAYYFEKKYPQAIEAFKKTIALQPDVLFAYLNLARCYSDYHQYDSSIVYYKKALEMDPQQQIAQQGLAWVMKMKEKSDTSRITSAPKP